MTGTSTEATCARDVRPSAESPTSMTFGNTPREPNGERDHAPVAVSALPPLAGNPERRVSRRKEGGTTPGLYSACRPLWRRALFHLPRSWRNAFRLIDGDQARLTKTISCIGPIAFD